MAAEQLLQAPLFDDLPTFGAPTILAQPKSNQSYELRNDLGIPAALFRELPPDPVTSLLLVDDIARELARLSGALDLVVR